MSVLRIILIIWKWTVVLLACFICAVFLLAWIKNIPAIESVYLWASLGWGFLGFAVLLEEIS